MPVSDEMVEAAQEAWAQADCSGVDNIDELWRVAIEAAERAAWQPIGTAPTDGTLVLVYAAPYCDLDGFVTVAGYHHDAGWCVDELRDVTQWRPTPHAP